MNDINAVRQTLQQTRAQLLDCGNVVATGVGYKITGGKKTDQLCMICSVTEKKASSTLASKDLIPKELNGIATDVVATGRFQALAVRTDRVRPAPGGVSIGHRDITAGTLGCLVKRNGQTVILSNNHVMANSNEASIGDAILQPGPHDGGKYPDDHIADLLDFVPISIDSGLPPIPDPSDCNIGNSIAGFLNGLAASIGSKTRLQAIKIRDTRPQAEDNLVDAAIAKPLNDADVSEEILEIGTIAGVAQGELNMAIKKSGRTTEFTTGVIEQVDVTVNVQYGTGKVARFTNQLMAGAMSQGGDSGSAVLNNDNQLIGLLFAGSDTSTIINNIDDVFTKLNLSL